MARNPVTSAERRGVIALVAVTLLVTIAGFIHRSCVNSTLPPPSSPVPAIAPADTASASQPKDSHRRKRKKGGSKKRRGRSKTTSPNVIPQCRDILGDTIP